MPRGVNPKNCAVLWRGKGRLRRPLRPRHAMRKRGERLRERAPSCVSGVDHFWRAKVDHFSRAPNALLELCEDVAAFYACAQSHVIVHESQLHDAQSPSLKHGWPDPVGPGVHAGSNRRSRRGQSGR